MAFSVQLYLRKDKVRASDGTAPVYVRVTAGRKSRYRSTGVRVKPKHWNENKRQVRKGDPLESAKNARLETALLEASTAAADARTGAEALRSIGPEKRSFSAFFRARIAELEEGGAFWESRKYATTLRKLEAALRLTEGADLDAADLDAGALRAFERYLKTKAGPKGKGNAPNTVRRELGRLRTVTRRAVREGVLTANPFERFDLPKGATVSRRKLTPDEIAALAALDLPAGSTDRVARDAFAFAFYGGGMRFGDVCTLRTDELHVEGSRVRMRYRMMKTGGLINLPLPPPALSILSAYCMPGADEPPRYVFPMLREGEGEDAVRVRRRIASHNATTNAALKRLAAAAGLRDPSSVSFHVARHSFADYARKASGNVYAVSKALGHANLTITETYLQSFDRDATDRLQDDLWGGESNHRT